MAKAITTPKGKIIINVEGIDESKIKRQDFKLTKVGEDESKNPDFDKNTGKYFFDDLTDGIYNIEYMGDYPTSTPSENVEIPSGKNQRNMGITFHFLSDLATPVSSASFENGSSKRAKHTKIDQAPNEFLKVKLTPSTGSPTKDQAFWELINDKKINFKHYSNFIDDVLFNRHSNSEAKASASKSKKLSYNYDPDERGTDAKRLPFNRTEAFSLLKFATEKYVNFIYNSRNYIESDKDFAKYVGTDNIIPYYDLIKSKIEDFLNEDAGNFSIDDNPDSTDATLIELIWNYWYEEGMVNQTMLAIARRFQNIKNGQRDPLGNFDLDPLRPLNNILWGYIQDAQHRLSILRRNYEYEHLYGLRLAGLNAPGFNPADRRYKFLQSFHQLLYEATEYFVQSDNTIIRPDGFKLLNALRDTHRILAEGAHNQFGDLPTVARIEMLMEQWILARPEVREFLGGRVMVPYDEPWMDRVDSMKALQGWDNTSITFYGDLAEYGEKIILGIRYGNWEKISNRDKATNWADAFRNAIQRYIHSYYTITGIDLSAQNVNINSNSGEKLSLPGMLIQQKLLREKSMMRRS